MPSIVQLTHPGSEHGPDKRRGKLKSWNKGNHKRKFLVSTGSYVDSELIQKRGKLAFWGEWEPPSVVQEFAKPLEANCPRWLHQPFLPGDLKDLEQGSQNTDPFVFGSSFRYFVCKQIRYKKRKSTSLAKLDKGSVILFGSTKGRKRDESFFQLDTVFVVSDYIDYDTSKPADSIKNENDPYWDIVFKREFPEPRDFSVKLRIYKGATFDKPFNNMYSFVPSRLWMDGMKGFPRLKLQNWEFLTNNLNAAPKSTGQSEYEIQTYWNKLRDYSRAENYLEGIQFDLP